MTNSKSFTLIELLVVIAIVGLLASIVLVSLQDATAHARDSKRDAEAGETNSTLRKTLEVYHSVHGTYPYNEETEGDVGCCIEDNDAIKLDLAPYITDTPQDPKYNPDDPKEDDDLSKYCYRYKTVDSGKEYKIRVNYERTGNKTIASWGGGGIDIEEPEIDTFIKSFGKGIFCVDRAISLLRNTDGEYIVTGDTLVNFDHMNVSVMRLDSHGNWIQTQGFGGDANDEGGKTIIETAGGYVVAGDKDGAGGDDIFVLKLNTSLEKIWAKTFGCADWDRVDSIIASPDEGYVVAGYTKGFGAQGEGFLVFKIDSAGDYIWTRRFGSARNDRANSIIASSDGGYVVAGRTGSNILVLKLNDADGSQVWAKSFSLSHDRECSIEEIPGGYILAASTNGNALVLKINSDGEQVWAKTFGGSDEEFANSIIVSDGGYITAGSTKSFLPLGGMTSSFIFKTDTNGNKVWAKAFTGNALPEIGLNISAIDNVQQVSGEGYITAGYDGYRDDGVLIAAMIAKLDLDGNADSCSWIQDVTDDISSANLGDISSAAADDISSVEIGDIFMENLDDWLGVPWFFLSDDVCPE